MASVFLLFLSSFINERRMMKPSYLFDGLQKKLSEVLKHSPFNDVKQTAHTMVQQGLNKMDIVTRAEFDVQTQVLARTRARLEELEARVAELEAAQHKP